MKKLGHGISNSTAFTLVELLIVVAIIAILAAIAIPNFLEAQTRAKVSRARADMRTIATALEAYATDHNHYPTFHLTSPTTEFFIGGTAGPGMVVDASFSGNPQITTPVAYLSSMPTDVFFGNPPALPAERVQFMYVNWRYASDRGVDTPDSFEAALQAYGDWQILSGGPTRVRDLGPANGEQTIPLYDPTNGTVSRGMLIRSAFDVTGRPVGL